MYSSAGCLAGLRRARAQLRPRYTHSASAKGQTGHLVRCGRAGSLQAADRTERQTDRHTRGGPETAQIPKMPTGYGPSDAQRFRQPETRGGSGGTDWQTRTGSAQTRGGSGQMRGGVRKEGQMRGGRAERRPMDRDCALQDTPTQGLKASSCGRASGRGARKPGTVLSNFPLAVCQDVKKKKKEKKRKERTKEKDLNGF